MSAMQWNLPLTPLGAESGLLIGVPNQEAVKAAFDPSWNGAMIAEGPNKSGKSTLARAWCARERAICLSATALDLENLDRFAGARAGSVDNLDALPSGEAQEVLFHLLNAAANAQGRLLLFSGSPVRSLQVALPDLRTRLASTPVYRLAQPDEDFLANLLMHLAEARQLALSHPVAVLAAARMPRTYEAAFNLIEGMDRLSLETGRAVTRELLAQALDGVLG